MTYLGRGADSHMAGEGESKSLDFAMADFEEYDDMGRMKISVVEYSTTYNIGTQRYRTRKPKASAEILANNLCSVLAFLIFNSSEKTWLKEQQTHGIEREELRYSTPCCETGRKSCSFRVALNQH